jgi:3-hydroxybutyryl-CoA dehydratase
MEKYKIGDFAESSKIYTTEMVKVFSNITGDVNPIHLDPEFSKNYIFKKPIVHGLLVASQISELIANVMPGPGSVYMAQNLIFKAPVFHNDEIICRVEIIKIILEKNIIELSTICTNSEKLIIIDGVATIKII